jgi:uncharacterized protein GlcG (DUF336 family)
MSSTRGDFLQRQCRRVERVGVAPLAWLGALALAASPSAHAQVLTQANVSVAQARKILDAVIAECSRPGTLVTVTVAVVDRVGLPVLQLRADTASPISVELAFRKAYTALSARGSSLSWRDRTAGDSELAGQRSLATMIPLGGGAAIMFGDQPIGAVGVSGAQGGQPADHACAEHGVAALADDLD